MDNKDFLDKVPEEINRFNDDRYNLFTLTKIGSKREQSMVDVGQCVKGYLMLLNIEGSPAIRVGRIDDYIRTSPIVKVIESDDTSTTFETEGGYYKLEMVPDYIMKNLVGKKINKVLISSDKTYLSFNTDEKNYLFSAEGDCCSQSWFEHFNGLNSLKNAVVDSTTEVFMNEIVEEEYYEHIKIYAIKIKTDKGYVDIEMRNSSNGFYGGSVEEITWFKTEDLENIKFKELEEDF